MTYVNHQGEFTFSAPSTWRVKSCESDIGYLFATDDKTVGCGRWEYYGTWLFGVSLEGDMRDRVPPIGNEYMYLSKVTGSQDVTTASGAKGVRYTAVEDKDGMIGSPKGTAEVYYVLSSADRTLAILYSRVPGAPDRTADFDRLVKETLHLGGTVTRVSL